MALSDNGKKEEKSDAHIFEVHIFLYYFYVFLRFLHVHVLYIINVNIADKKGFLYYRPNFAEDSFV